MPNRNLGIIFVAHLTKPLAPLLNVSNLPPLMFENRAIFFPGLNGLRAIAALAVVLSHTTVYLGEFNLDPHIIGSLANGNPKGIDLSDFAVSIFFALSGFLITYLLLVEDQTNEINIKHFYVRRILRIWPLYYFYYILVLFFIHIWRIPHTEYTNLFYIFFSANIPKVLDEKSDLLGHYWSLGVEEHFYLFWPWVVKKWAKQLKSPLLLILAILIILKAVSHFIFPGTYFESAMYVNRFDCMLIGALGSYLYFQNNKIFIYLFTHPAAQLLAWLAIFSATFNKFHIAAVFDHEIMSVFTVVLIIGQIKSKNKIINLNTNAFDFLGKISYGIYVIHPLVIFAFAKIYIHISGTHTTLNYFFVYGAVLGLTVAMAYFSYEYLEKPFLKMKDDFAATKTISSKQHK